MADVTNGFAPDDPAMRGARAYGASAAGASAGEAGRFGAGSGLEASVAVEGPTVAGKAGMAVQLVGAAMSLALLLGGAVWGYKLIVRDATGVPVVRSMSGPMREAPADPGGEVALHTGLSVNAVAAMGEAAPPEDVLVLAPATADLTDEDLQVMPMAEADEMRPGSEVAAVADAEPVPEPPQTVTLAQPSDQPMSAEDVLALADAIAAGATPMADLAEAPLTAPPPEEEATAGLEALPDANMQDGDGQALLDGAPDAVAAAVPPAEDAVGAVADAVAAAVLEATAADAPAAEEAVVLAAVDADGRLMRSLRPPARPAALATASATASDAATPDASVQPSPDAATVAVSTTEVPVGTTLVQLGAFDTPDLAGAEWARLAGRFAEFMADKERLIQEASSGGRAFYRLRATGFVDIADARRFCSALVAEDAPCIPVVVQ